MEVEWEGAEMDLELPLPWLSQQAFLQQLQVIKLSTSQLLVAPGAWLSLVSLVAAGEGTSGRLGKSGVRNH